VGDNNSPSQIGIQNQPSTVTRLDPVVNNDGSVSPFQHIANSLKHLKREAAKNSKATKELYGINLFAINMPISKFIKKYDENTSFYKSVIQKNGNVIKPKKDSFVIKAYGYIPEISGCLPFPDYEIYTKFMKLYNRTDEPTQQTGQKYEEFEKIYEEYNNRIEKEVTEMSEAVFKEFEKIVMHPIFYKYSEAETAPNPFQFLKVQYKGDFDGYHTGILVEQHQEYYVARSENVE
tara:strand:- start:2240 stop:2941 length:702 start_codon:yes stop_codon:yes gene_type:complete